MELYCSRCGRYLVSCPHLSSGHTTDAELAKRIAARYALGKQFDPEHHDTNDYATEDT
jgi:hypothetical protein